jgi:hypothetical protein
MLVLPACTNCGGFPEYVVFSVAMSNLKSKTPMGIYT